MKKSLYIKLIVFFGILLGVVSGCKKEMKISSQEHIFPGDQWSKADFLNFTMNIPENAVGKPFEMYVEFDYTPNIRRDMITLEMSAYSPEGDERVANYKVFFKGSDGRFKGEAEGNILHLTSLLRGNYVFGKAGEWRYELTHRSELYNFEGLRKIRLVLIESPVTDTKKN